jgi:hypothetical protein
MSDTGLVTLLSVVISVLITATGAVIAAYISKGKNGETQTQTIFTPDGYVPPSTKRFWSKRSVAIILFTFIFLSLLQQ